MDTPDSSDLQMRYFYNLAHHEPATWRWDFGDGSPVSTDTSALHTYAQPGKYRVCLTVANQYGTDTYCREVYVGVVANETAPQAAAGLQLLPNPADMETTLYLAEALGSNGAMLFVRDALGRLVLKQRIQGQLTTIETAKWPPGVYFVRVECVGSTSLTARLVVHR